MRSDPPKNEPALTLEKVWIWNDILYDTRLLPSAVRVGMALTDVMTLPDTLNRYRSDGKIIVWPSHKYLNKKTDVGHDTVKGAIKKLNELGYIKTIKRGNRESGPNHYQIRTSNQRKEVPKPPGKKSEGEPRKKSGGLKRKFPSIPPGKTRV